MPDFISDNPALTSYYQTGNNIRAQQMGDIQLRGAQQTEGANNAIDAGLRSWFQNGGQQPTAAPASPAPTADPSQTAGAPPSTPAPQPDPTAMPASPQPTAAQPRQSPLSAIGTAPAAPSNPIDPYASTYAGIANTPGTGKALMAMNSAGIQRKQDMTFKMFDAMDKGELPQAQYLAQQVGFNLPPQAWNDVRTIRLIGQAKYFHDAYKDDPQGFGTFLQTAMRGADANGGVPDWQGALKASPPRSKGAANYEGYQEATGQNPSPEAAGFMFGGGRSFAPSFGTTTVGGEDGQPPQIAVVNRRTGALTNTGQTAARSVAPLTRTVTVQGANGPEVVSVDARTGRQVGTVGAAPPRSEPTTLADRDLTAARTQVANDPLFMSKTDTEREAEIQRRYEAAQAGRQRNNTSQRRGAVPSVTSGSATSGPATSGPASTPPSAPANHAGTEQDPHQPQSPQDWQALPTGAVYRDPGDGQLYRKP